MFIRKKELLTMRNDIALLESEVRRLDSITGAMGRQIRVIQCKHERSRVNGSTPNLAFLVCSDCGTNLDVATGHGQIAKMQREVAERDYQRAKEKLASFYRQENHND